MRRDPSVHTGSSLALNYTDGQRHFICWQPNNYTLAYPDIDPAVLDGGGHLLRADVWFAEPMLNGGNAELFAAARRRGLRTSLDLNWDPQWNTASAGLVQARKESVRKVLPLVDLVHGNVRELNRFADGDDLPATLERLTAWGAGAVVVHLGAEGAGYYCRGQWLVEPAAAGPATRQFDRLRRPDERLLHASGRPDRDPAGREAAFWPTASSPST